MFSASSLNCPKCNGRIDTKSFSWAALFGTMALGDVATYILAGVFILAGLMWEPAWAIALLIVIIALCRKYVRETHYVCAECRAEFTHKQLYAKS